MSLTMFVKLRKNIISTVTSCSCALGLLSAPASHAAEVSGGLTFSGIFDSNSHAGFSLSITSEPTAFYGIKVVSLYGRSFSNNNDYYSVGLLHTFSITERVTVGLGFQAGYLKHNDILGDNIEFLSRILVGFRATDDVRVRLLLGHISNGGLGSKNPGSEILTLGVVYTLK